MPTPARSLQLPPKGPVLKPGSSALYTIPPATPKANGMVERAQRSSREEHYAHEPPCLTLTEERIALASFVHHYNHYRPHQALAYQTPNEYHHARNPTCLK